LTDGFQDQGIVLNDENVDTSTSEDSSWDSSEEEEEESEGEDEECNKVEENIIIRLNPWLSLRIRYISRYVV
jgi:hypothetical protein